MSEDPLKKCPECAELALRRLISGGSGIIFKGSGFYVTDSRKGSKSSEGSTKSSAKAGDKSDKSAKSDSSNKNSSTDAA